MTRRKFLEKSALVSGAGVIAAVGAQAAANPAKVADVKPVLYSVTFGGVWYQGPGLGLDDVVEKAKKYGFAGIEIDGKHPAGYALDWPKDRCVEFRKKVADKGLVIAAVAANNDFSSPIGEHRECQVAYVKDLIRMTSDITSEGNPKILRVFFGWPGVTRNPSGGSRYDIAQNTWKFLHDNFTEEQTWDWCREGMIEAAKIAGDYGVTLALQNHKPVLKTYHDTIRMVKEVNSPNLKICLDAPIMEKQDADYLRQAVLDVGPLMVHSHYGGEYSRDSSGGIVRPSIQGHWGAEYTRSGDFEKHDIYLPFLKAMMEIGYNGYMGYELCHPLPVVNGQLVGLDFVESNTQLGLEFIKGAISQAKKEVAEEQLKRNRVLAGLSS
jgi:sugar phosphate isomerase/epimerase